MNANLKPLTPSLREIRKSCRNCSLASLCLPRTLNDHDLDKLDEVIETRSTLHKDDVLFEQGLAANYLYAVRSGSIHTYTTAKNGDKQSLGFHLAGELLGLNGFDNQIHSCSAVALETTSVCQLAVSDLHSLCLLIEGLQRQLVSLLSDEICKDHNMLLLMARCNAEQKLAKFFISLSTRLQNRGRSASEFNLTMTRSQIANYLGLTDETVSRIITKFRQAKIIQADRRLITILQPKTLANIAENGKF